MVSGTKKEDPEDNGCLRGPPFLFQTLEVNINEYQICSKCSVIKWETFKRKCFEGHHSILHCQNW